MQRLQTWNAVLGHGFYGVPTDFDPGRGPANIDPLTLSSKRRDAPRHILPGRDANTIQRQHRKSDAAASRMEQIGQGWIGIFLMARSRGVDEVNDRGRGSHEQEYGRRSMYVGIGIGALAE